MCKLAELEKEGNPIKCFLLEIVNKSWTSQSCTVRHILFVTNVYVRTFGKRDLILHKLTSVENLLRRGRSLAVGVDVFSSSI